MDPHEKSLNDTDFMGDLDAAVKVASSPSMSFLLYIIIGLIGFIIVWAKFSEIEVITRGQGQVIPTSEIQLVQSLEGGILSDLNVSVGDRVDKGQLLARIRNVAFASEERGYEVQALSLQLKKQRLNAEINNKNFSINENIKVKNKDLSDAEMALFYSRKNELNKLLDGVEKSVNRANANLQEVKAAISRMVNSRNLLSQQLDITRKLVAKNAMPKLEGIKQEREFSDINGEIATTQQRQKSLQAELASVKNKREEILAQFKSAALTELTDVEMQIAAIEERLTTAGDRVDRTELRAPVDGVIQSIGQKTLGGIVEPAMKLMEIVPLNDDLKIRAKIEPADIAFLKIDQDVNVKVTAYDPQKFGALKGKLKRVSADTIEDKDGNIFFEIDVVTDKNYLGNIDNKLPIIPGMVADVEVVTGKRSIMDYMLKPFLRARDRALTEQ